MSQKLRLTIALLFGPLFLGLMGCNESGNSKDPSTLTQLTCEESLENFHSFLELHSETLKPGGTCNVDADCILFNTNTPVFSCNVTQAYSLIDIPIELIDEAEKIKEDLGQVCTLDNWPYPLPLCPSVQPPDKAVCEENICKPKYDFIPLSN